MTFDKIRERVEERISDLPQQELVCHFVGMFSRFEYALKATGFFKRPKPPKTKRRAEPDWDAFAESLKSRLRDVPNESVKEAIEYFDAQPPKKQVIVEGVLTLDDRRAREHNDKELLMLVRQVRNNLFHGGKPDVGMRSQNLLRHAETLMIAALLLNDDVRKAFVRKKLNAAA
jgi:hypothetical protein